MLRGSPGGTFAISGVAKDSGTLASTGKWIRRRRAAITQRTRTLLWRVSKHEQKRSPRQKTCRAVAAAPASSERLPIGRPVLRLRSSYDAANAPKAGHENQGANLAPRFRRVQSGSASASAFVIRRSCVSGGSRCSVAAARGSRRAARAAHPTWHPRPRRCHSFLHPRHPDHPPRPHRPPRSTVHARSAVLQRAAPERFVGLVHPLGAHAVHGRRAAELDRAQIGRAAVETIVDVGKDRPTIHSVRLRVQPHVGRHQRRLVVGRGYQARREDRGAEHQAMRLERRLCRARLGEARKLLVPARPEVKIETPSGKYPS